MSLEFTKIMADIERMGRYLAYRDREELIERALRVLQEKGSDLQFIQDRIRTVRESDISGYRGAALPPDDVTPLPFSEVFDAPKLPEQAVMIAVDGSQIYPDDNASSLYYLLNIGSLVYYHGTGEMPRQNTHPMVFYTDNYMKDEHKQTISNRTVNSRRTVAEIRTLWQEAKTHRRPDVPIVAIHDGNLLKFFGGSDVTDANSLIKEYMGLLVALHDMNTVFAGYVDTPRSSYLISLLHLLDLPDDQIHDATVSTDGDFEGLTDLAVLERHLEAGQRSALMVQNSPMNYEYQQFNPNHEIAVFYMNVAEKGQRAHIARVDVPMWVARQPHMIDMLHALLLHQCRMQGIRPYPYMLTRADELAYVSGHEKAQVERLVRRELMKNNIHSKEQSAKAGSKDFARDDFKTNHRLGG